MRRRLAALAVLFALGIASNAQAAQNDPVGDLISSVISGALPGTGVFNVKATLYHAGAKGVGRELNDRDRWLVGQIGPTLRQRGMLFVGLDVIGGYVTEINVTSPTGVRELDKQFGVSIAGLLMDAIEKRLS